MAELFFLVIIFLYWLITTFGGWLLILLGLVVLFSVLWESSIHSKNKKALASKSPTSSIYNFPVPKIDVQAPSVIHRGEVTVLKWEIHDAVMVILHYDGKAQTVAHTGELKIHPTKFTSYEFEVIGSDGVSIFHPVTVSFEEPAKIIKFEANRDFSFPNIPVTLSWRVDNAKFVSIDNLGEQPSSGSINVTSGVDTTYILRVADAFGEQSCAITIYILPLPIVNARIPAPNINMRLNTRYITPRCETNIIVPTFESTLINIKKPNIPKLKQIQLNVKDIYKNNKANAVKPIQTLFTYFFCK